MRAVLDPNVLISALLSPRGSPAQALRSWLDGGFELIVSPALLAALERALAYPKLRRRIPREDGHAFVEMIRRSATLADDPTAPAAIHSRDPDDDYLLALAASERAALVSGDKDLLALQGDHPIYSPNQFFATIEPV